MQEEAVNAEPARSDHQWLERFLLHSPFHLWLGLSLEDVTAAGIVVRMPWRDEFLGNPQARIMHGGILASLIDLSAVLAIVAVTRRGPPTVDLRIDYHAPVPTVPVLCHARIVRIGATLAVSEARVTAADSGKLYASGRGTFLTLQRKSTDG